MKQCLNINCSNLVRTGLNDINDCAIVMRYKSVLHYKKVSSLSEDILRNLCIITKLSENYA